MVFIDKTTPHSVESKNRLETWKALLDLAQLYAEPNQTGDALWDIKEHQFQDVKDRLRHDLSIEQGHICCYCTQSLKSIRTKIEHFLAKSAPEKPGVPRAKMSAFTSTSIGTLRICTIKICSRPLISGNDTIT